MFRSGRITRYTSPYDLSYRIRVESLVLREPEAIRDLIADVHFCCKEPIEFLDYGDLHSLKVFDNPDMYLKPIRHLDILFNGVKAADPFPVWLG